MPKGYTTRKTLSKEAAKAVLRAMVVAELTPMTQAQVSAAKGIQHFVLRDKAGKFQKVTSAEAAVAAMNNPEAVYEFWARDPSIQAYAYLVDQALDKAAQPQQVTGQDGGPLVFTWQK